MIPKAAVHIDIVSFQIHGKHLVHCITRSNGRVESTKRPSLDVPIIQIRHSYYLLGLHRRLTLLLSVIVNETSLKEDKDIRQLLTMLAIITEPNNIDVNFDPNNGGFTRRYSKYLEELQKLKPVSIGISVTRKIEENQATSRMNKS